MGYRKEAALSVFAILIVTLLALALVWVRVETIRLGFECARISRELDTALRVQKKLQLEWERLTAYPELERIAVNELGLSPPDPRKIEFLEDELEEGEK